MTQFTESSLLLLVLLNPFILSVYLVDIVRETEFHIFARSIMGAALISLFVFSAFASFGDAIFTNVLQIRFSSFLIFGGITFLIVGIRLITGAGPAIKALQRGSTGVSSAIAMPLMIGPGTISASVLTGSLLEGILPFLAILCALASATGAILMFKLAHDYVRERNEPLVQRYVEIAARVTALFVGSFAIEMIMTGLQGWMAALTVP